MRFCSPAVRLSLAGLALFALASLAARALPKNNVPKGLSQATHVARVSASKQMNLTVVMKLHDQAGFDQAVADLYDTDYYLSLYNQSRFISAIYPYSSSVQFAVRFGTDTSLTTASGWDYATGWGEPNGKTFVQTVTGKTTGAVTKSAASGQDASANGDSGDGSSPSGSTRAGERDTE